MDFGGWLLPVQYEGVLAEHRWCRASAAVFDTSHMGQFVIRGAGAARALSCVCTQDAGALPVGRCRYGFLLNEHAGVIDDTILMRLVDQEFLLVVNAGRRQADAEWLRQHLGEGATLEDRSAAGWGKIDLQGPKALDAIGPLAKGDLRSMPYFGVGRATFSRRQCVISRTGYTGELGYEIMAAGEDLPAIWQRLLAHQAVRPAGLGARDSLRLEMCYPLYGHELSTDRTPLEAGLGRFVSLERDYIGAEGLRAAAAVRPSEKLVALRAGSRRRAGPGDAVLSGGRAVGVITSGAFSPSLDCSIALAYVTPGAAATDTRLTVRTERAELPVVVVDRPFYTHGSCKTRS